MMTSSPIHENSNVSVLVQPSVVNEAFTFIASSFNLIIIFHFKLMDRWWFVSLYLFDPPLSKMPNVRSATLENKQL